MKHLAFLVIVLIPIILPAQKNYQEGYVVNSKGDTLKGYIDYKEWSRTPTNISFKSYNNQEVQTLEVSDVSYFEVLKKEVYKRFRVRLSLDPIQIDRISIRDTSTDVETVFLKVIYVGNSISLYSFTDKIKERFFISKAGQVEPTELVYRKYFEDVAGSNMITDDTYRSQLENLMYTENKFSDKLAKEIKER